MCRRCKDAHHAEGVSPRVPRGRDPGVSRLRRRRAQVAKDFGFSPSCLKPWLVIDDRRSANPFAGRAVVNEADALGGTIGSSSWSRSTRCPSPGSQGPSSPIRLSAAHPFTGRLVLRPPGGYGFAMSKMEGEDAGNTECASQARAGSVAGAAEESRNATVVRRLRSRNRAGAPPTVEIVAELEQGRRSPY